MDHDAAPPQPGPDDVPVELVIQGLQQQIADQALRISILLAQLARQSAAGGAPVA